MKHARSDYQRIQDLTHVIEVIDGMLSDPQYTDDPELR